jgi:hypothetical protein
VVTLPLPVSAEVIAAVAAAVQLVEITAAETVVPPYKALTRSSAAPSPKPNDLKEGRPEKRSASSGVGSRDDDDC